METSDTVLYQIADALHIELHEMDNRIRGFETRELQVGGWKFSADVSVISDCLGKDHASFFAKIVGNLWLYLIAGKGDLIAVVLDGSVLKLHVKDIAGYGGKSIAATLKKLKPGIVTGYTYDELTKKWSEDGACHLVYLGPETNTVIALPAPTAVSGPTD